MAIDDIKNFLQVDERLGTAGQPTEEQLGEVAASGYQVVVNLGLLDPRYCLPDEAGLVPRLGMEYHHIPVTFDEPKVTDFERFVAVMDRASPRRTFVHCALNWRGTAFTALYGQLRAGWSVERADAQIRRFWEPNQTWLDFVAGCREQLGLGPKADHRARET
jgi:protein tyrosine phosphatase (PTP) superfamily phosphohydrolase (DUF442 family)